MPTPDAAALPAPGPAPSRALHLAEEVEGTADVRRAARRARLIAVGHPSVTDPTGGIAPDNPGSPTTRPPTHS